jgi:hypothetical protein
MSSIPCFLTIRQGGIRNEEFSTTTTYVLLDPWVGPPVPAGEVAHGERWRSAAPGGGSPTPRNRSPGQLLQERRDLGERQTIINGTLVLGRLRHRRVGRLTRVLDDGGSPRLLHGLQSQRAIAEIAAQNDANHPRPVTSGRRGKQPVHRGTRRHVQCRGDRVMSHDHGQIMSRRPEENRACQQRSPIGRKSCGKISLTGEDGGQVRRECRREMLGYTDRGAEAPGQAAHQGKEGFDIPPPSCR